MKKLVAVLAALPIAAFAQGGGPQGEGPGGWRPGQGPPTAEQLQQMQKRARLALTLGLAVALDLDPAQALKLSDVVGKSLDRRRPVHEQVRGARETLRRAAQGEKVSAADVDQAIAKLQDAQAQIQALNKELVANVTKDLGPEKKARAVLFLSKFQKRFGRGGMHGMRGPGGPGMMGPGMMRGPGGPGGPGMMRGGPTGFAPGTEQGAMAGACAAGDCGWDEGD